VTLALAAGAASKTAGAKRDILAAEEHDTWQSGSQ
jgi:hypothetical protein